MPSPSPTSKPRPAQPDKALLSAWLLLLLYDGERHGWALRGELAGQGIIVDGARVYRDLRALESAGALTSRWTASVGGPRRRCYRLSAGGLATLDELAANVSATWQLHAEFVQAHERSVAPRPDDADPQDTTHDHDAAPRMTRELIAAWLLLLLGHGASYGYDLRRALDDHDIHPDAGTLYRVLRRLDDSGWLQSRWMASVAGPRRRLYRVTGRGRRNLDELTVLITGSRDSHAAFLDAYRKKLDAGGAQRNGR